MLCLRNIRTRPLSVPEFLEFCGLDMIITMGTDREQGNDDRYVYISTLNIKILIFKVSAS